MRILQLLNRVPWPLYDGGSIGYYNFIKGYTEAGCDVTVLAMNTSKHRVEQLPPELNRIAKWILVDVDNRVKPFGALFNLFGNESYHVQRFQSKAFSQKLETILNEHQFDVVIFESLFVMPYWETVNKHSSALTVLREHNIEHHIWQTLAKQTGNPFKRWYLNLLANRLKSYEKGAIQKVQALTTVTADDKKVLADLGCTKPIHVTPLAVSISSKQNHPTPPSVFHIGSMEWMPNIEGIRWFTNEVWPKVIQISPTTQLHLAGRGIERQFQSIPEQHIYVDGEVPNAVDFMNAHSIMIVPLFSGSGIRVKILEGMAAGRAVISTTLGAQGINYTTGKNILIADTADDFAKAILTLIQLPEQILQLAKAGQELVQQQYSYSKVIHEAIDFYRIQIQNKVSDV